MVVSRGCTGRSRVVVVCFVVRRALVLLWFGLGHVLSTLPMVGGAGGVVVLRVVVALVVVVLRFVVAVAALVS